MASCSLPVDEDVASTDAGTASMTSTEKLRHAADLLGISVQDLSRALAAQTLSINTGHSSDHVETDGGHFNHAQALILETPNEDAMHAPEQSCDGTGDSLVSWLQTYANGPSHQDIFHLDTWLGTDRYDPSLFLPELDTAVSCSTEHVDAFQLAGDGAQQYPPQESHDLLQSSAPANSTEDDKAGATAGTIPHDHEIPQDSTLRPPSLSGTSTGRISKQDGKGVQATNAGGLMLPQLSRTTASLSRTMTPGSSTASSHTLSRGSTPTSTRQRDEAGRRFRYLAEHGPCSNVWIPPRTGRGNRTGCRKRKRNSPDPACEGRTRTRAPFQDPVKRLETAETRRRGACVRCFMMKLRCVSDPDDPSGPCATCLGLKRSVVRLPCLRYKITDASLFRKQKFPNPFYSKRWKSMEIQDITDWASESRKTVQFTHGFEGAKYTLELREFVPVEGDSLEEMWYDGEVPKRHFIPPYAIVDMKKAAKELERYVHTSIAPFTAGIVGYQDEFLWRTYRVAFRHAHESPREDERRLLVNALRLWVTARMTSLPEKICSKEQVGTTVEDKSSPYYGTVPVAPVICAQFEVIMFCCLQMPLRGKVLEGLASMMRSNDRRNWFTIYLTLFILLHSCSMTTKRNQEYATQMAMRTRFANPDAISEHHIGMMTMLAYFHYCNKGRAPFQLVKDTTKRPELEAVAELNAEQLKFVEGSADWMRQNWSRVQRVREARDFGDHYYFVSQLFDEDWRPTAIA